MDEKHWTQYIMVISCIFLMGHSVPFFQSLRRKKKTFPGIKANQNKHNIKPNLDEMQEWDSDCEQVKSRKKDIEWALYLSLLQHTQNELKQNQEITGSTYPLLYWFSFSQSLFHTSFILRFHAPSYFVWTRNFASFSNC